MSGSARVGPDLQEARRWTLTPRPNHLSKSARLHGSLATNWTLVLSFAENSALYAVLNRPSRNPDYSQRNTFADSAVHTTNTADSAARSARCADHRSPLHIPSSSDTV